MAFITADFVKETSTTTGLGAIFLAGARAPARTVGSVCADGDTFHCAVSNTSINEWEVFVGTYVLATNSVTRGATLSSSNGGAPVNFGIGTKFVDLVLPTTRIVSFKTTLPLVSHVGGNSVSDLSTLAFSNASNVTWSLSTGANAATVIASVAAGGGGAGQIAYAGPAANELSDMTATTSLAIGSFAINSGGGSGSIVSRQNVFFRFSGSTMEGGAFMRIAGTAGNSSAVAGIQASESNGVTLGFATATLTNVGVMGVVTASYARELGLFSQIGGNTVSNVTRLAVSNGTNFSWAAATAAGAVTLLGSAANDQIGVVSHVGGNSVSNVTQLAFSNASGVTFSLSTAASAATLLASANDRSLGLISHNGGQSQSNVATLQFINASNIAWTLSTGAGLVQVRASAVVNFSAGTTAFNNTNIVFSDSNGVSFGLNSSTITASYAREIGLLSHVGGNSVASATRLAFANSNGISFGLSTAAGAATLTASVGAGGAAGSISAGTTSVALGQAVFSDSNNVIFGLNGSTVTASAGFGLLSHVGGQSINGATRLAFSNASNVTFSLSTAAGAATLLASVDPNPAALAVSAAGASASAGTVVWSNSNNVSFGQAGSTITATATVAATRDIGIVSHIGGNVVSSVSQLAFSNASNVTWSLSTAANAATVIASVAAGGGGGATFGGFAPYSGGIFVTNQGLGNAQLWLNPMPAPAFSFDRVALMLSISNASNSSGTHTLRMGVGLYTRNVSTLSLLASSSGTTALTLSGTQGNYSQFSGARLWTMGWSSSFSQGDYWLGVITSLSTGGANAGSFSLGMYSQSAGNVSFGLLGGAGTNSTIQPLLGRGLHGTTQSVPPASVAFSQINFAASSIAWRQPLFNFASGTA